MVTRLAVAALALLLAMPAAAQKSIHWKRMHVNARLDRDGRLHVEERQTMVLNGEWNGGERVFGLTEDQQLELHRIRRDHGRGELRQLVRGDLTEVDQYDFVDGNTLRWRSRLQDDPPFHNQELTYLLEYSMSGVLRETEFDTFELRHDFLFADRPGPVLEYTLHLELDPAWRGVPSPVIRRDFNVQPGDSHTVWLRLTHAGRPATTGPAAPPFDRFIAQWGVAVSGVAMAIALAILGALAMARERRQQRTAPIAEERIDEEWLEREILPLRAEVAGAARNHGAVDGAQVAALLVRLMNEGKIAIEKDGEQPLQFRLLVPFDTLDGYEADLVRALFLGRASVSAQDIREFYAGSGFRPAAIVGIGIRAELEKTPLRARGIPVGVVFGMFLLAVAFMLAVGTFFSDGGHGAGATTIVTMLLVPLPWYIARSANPHRPPWTSLFIGLGLIAFLLLGGMEATPRLTPGGAIAGVLTLIAAAIIAFDALAHREMPEAAAFVGRLLHARQFLLEELRAGNAKTRDEWYAHGIALGLGLELGTGTPPAGPLLELARGVDPPVRTYTRYRSRDPISFQT